MLVCEVVVDVEDVGEEAELWELVDDVALVDDVVPVVLVVVPVFTEALGVVVGDLVDAGVVEGAWFDGVGVVDAGGTAVLEVLGEVGSPMALTGASSALFFLIMRLLRSTCSALLTIGGGFRFIPWRAWALGTAVRDNWATTAVKTRVKNERRAIVGEY